MMGNIFLYKKYLKLDIVSSSVQGRYLWLIIPSVLQRQEFSALSAGTERTCKSSGQSVRTVTEKRTLGWLPFGDCSWSRLQSHTVRRSRSYCSLVLSAFHVLSSSPVLTGRLRRPEALVFGQPRCLACF